MPRFPPPHDEAFLLAEGKPVPVEALPRDEWLERRRRMLENVGRAVSDDLTRGE